MNPLNAAQFTVPAYINVMSTTNIFFILMCGYLRMKAFIYRAI